MNIRVLLACLAMLTACAAPQPAVGAEPLLQAVREMQAELVYRYTNINGIAARIPPPQDMAQAIRSLERVPGVLQVQRDQIMQLQNPAAH